MAFSEFEIALHQQTLEEAFWAHRRPPDDMHDKIRDGQRIEGHTIELFYIRPYFRDPTKTVEEPIAKIRYVRSQNHWQLLWKRASGKWEGYPPEPIVDSLGEALEIIHEDKLGCFFG